jgi:hypothetical protein
MVGDDMWGLRLSDMAPGVDTESGRNRRSNRWGSAPNNSTDQYIRNSTKPTFESGRPRPPFLWSGVEPDRDTYRPTTERMCRAAEFDAAETNPDRRALHFAHGVSE